jgi:hypothetical protein
VCARVHVRACVFTPVLNVVITCRICKLRASYRLLDVPTWLALTSVPPHKAMPYESLASFPDLNSSSTTARIDVGGSPVSASTRSPADAAGQSNPPARKNAQRATASPQLSNQCTS